MGCHVGHRYSVAFVYVHDLTWLSPNRSGLSVLISDCERNATDCAIPFNVNKSKVLHFKGRFCKPVKVRIIVNTPYVNTSETAVR